MEVGGGGGGGRHRDRIAMKGSSLPQMLHLFNIYWKKHSHIELTTEHQYYYYYY